MRVLRYEVPVDDKQHTLEVDGPIVSVNCRDLDAVEFWTMAGGASPPRWRTFLVVGTGHLLPSWAGAGSYRGTGLAPNTRLVWHLLEKDVDVAAECAR
jgi:hypothetical protein